MRCLGDLSLSRSILGRNPGQTKLRNIPENLLPWKYETQSKISNKYTIILSDLVQERFFF